jgi:O-antigen ligase
VIDRARDNKTTSSDTSSGETWLMWPLAAFLIVSFFAAEHDMKLVGRQIGGVEESSIVDDYLDDSEGGNRVRQIGYLSFAALGCVFLCSQSGRRWEVHWGVAALIGATLAWSLTTAVWSIDPSQSLRRLAVVVCCLAGALGIARRVSALQLCRLVVVVGLSLTMFSFALELAVGVRPWASGFRFGGTLHPNITACYAAFVCLAAYCLAGQSRQKVVWWAIMALCVVLVLLTRSRTALGALVVAFAVLWLASCKPLTRWWAISTLTAWGAALIFLLAAGDVAVRNRVFDTFLLGRRSEASSLTGRVPLWQELATYAEKRPWQGYGYECFWSPEHIEELFRSQKWAISSAHSAYMELTLGIGLVGVVLATATVVWGTWLAYRRFQKTENLGYGFVFAALVYGLANAVLESVFVETRFPSVVALCGMLMVACFALHRSELSDPPSIANRRNRHWFERARFAGRVRRPAMSLDRRWTPPSPR